MNNSVITQCHYGVIFTRVHTVIGKILIYTNWSAHCGKVQSVQELRSQLMSRTDLQVPLPFLEVQVFRMFHIKCTSRCRDEGECFSHCGSSACFLQNLGVTFTRSTLAGGSWPLPGVMLSFGHHRSNRIAEPMAARSKGRWQAGLIMLCSKVI